MSKESGFFDCFKCLKRNNSVYLFEANRKRTYVTMACFQEDTLSFEPVRLSLEYNSAKNIWKQLVAQGYKQQNNY